MYFSKAAIATLLTALTLASASPMLEDRQSGATCQTSDGSPDTGDVTDVINELKGRDPSEKCPNTNGQASECTTLVSHNSGAIGVCGEEDDANSALTCQQVAQYANEVQQDCLANGKAGGTYTVNPGKRIIVMHSE
ncbi:hypothetical protein F5Y04DRAFT_287024 [Hypomontagnella monticulosa]|nr:hypothetical protein F5Y04DRAFT_287024 [Hypomontagnella monticulosa]